MNREPARNAEKLLPSFLLRGGLALLAVLAWLTMDAGGQTQHNKPVESNFIHVTHILGFEDVPRNLIGELLIDDDYLHFQRDGRASARVSIASIQNISLGEQDKQVGGVPMTLGKAAVPFEGGRVISLFTHKKYDSVALEYRDNTCGLHGVVFRMAKGQAEVFKSALLAHGVHTDRSDGPARPQSTREESVQAGKWRVQVARVDPGSTTLDPCFSDAIYENLLRELNKSKQFESVSRDGDRNANDASAPLILKAVVEKYSRGSETRRAVTTVAGATKLNVHIQLVTPDGRVVLERAVVGNVRFIGDNLKATNKVASHTAHLLKRSLPQPAAVAAQQATAKVATATP
jgi:hypothetical protein